MVITPRLSFGCYPSGQQEERERHAVTHRLEQRRAHAGGLGLGLDETHKVVEREDRRRLRVGPAVHLRQDCASPVVTVHPPPPPLSLLVARSDLVVAVSVVEVDV